jgi:pyridine nucleotide-disulfide oxidoreductase family protein
MKHLVLAGGGHAHVEVLRRLAREPLHDVRISVVSPYPRSLYSGMVPGVIAGHYRRSDAEIGLRELALGAGAKVFESRVCAVDAGAGRVTLDRGETIGYDVLSLDIGSVIDTGAIAGAAEHALAVRPIENLLDGVGVLLARAERRFLGVVVVGGGAAAVELALALQYRLGQRARVSLVTGGTSPLPGFPPRTQARARQALRRLAVRIIEDTCTGITERQLRLAAGEAVSCDAAILAIGGSAVPWLRDSGLRLDEAGFVATGATLQSVSHRNVFAVGDTASRTDAPHPKSGVYAVRAGPALALNLRRCLDGAALVEHHPPARSLNLLACGARHAIASWNGWSAEGRWVWWWKDRIDRGFIARYR